MFAVGSEGKHDSDPVVGNAGSVEIFDQRRQKQGIVDPATGYVADDDGDLIARLNHLSQGRRVDGGVEDASHLGRNIGYPRIAFSLDYLENIFFRQSKGEVAFSVLEAKIFHRFPLPQTFGICPSAVR